MAGGLPHVMELFRLTGRTALVTGGSRGLGRVIAEALAEAGADRLHHQPIARRRPAGGRGDRGATGGRVMGIAGEVTGDAVSVSSENDANTRPGDILVNNAGVNIRGAAGELSEADWDTVLDTNLKGLFLVPRASAPAMCERSWGRVINLSVDARVGCDRRPRALRSSKAGVLGLTRVLALEWAQRVSPSTRSAPVRLHTDMNRQLLNDPAKYKAFVQKLPLGRWGELHEIKGIALFLASDASSFMTGAALASTAAGRRSSFRARPQPPAEDGVRAMVAGDPEQHAERQADPDHGQVELRPEVVEAGVGADRVAPGAGESQAQRHAGRTLEALVVDFGARADSEAELAAARAGVGLEQEALGAVRHRDGADRLDLRRAVLDVGSQPVH